MECFISQILLVPFDYTPEYFAPCNGSLLSIHNNEALFSLIGTKFGGDAKSNFALPNLTAPPGLHYIICTNGIYPSRP